jgi:hypothetical protein
MRDGLALDVPELQNVHAGFPWTVLIHALTASFWAWATSMWLLWPTIFGLQVLKSWYAVTPDDSVLKRSARSFLFGAGAAGFTWAMRSRLLHDM